MRPVALLVAVWIAGCTATEPDPPWHGRDLSQPGWTEEALVPRASIELDFHRQAGQPLEWDWFVDEEQVVYFEAHRHDQAGHRYYARSYLHENASSVEADAPGTYSLVWSNPHPEPVTLWFHVPPDGVRLQ